jgi:translation initiation factor eIF-2B subunit gamma
MILQASLGGASAGTLDYEGPKMGIGGEKGGRRGGLGVWFETKGEGSVKGEETDFIITAPLTAPTVPAPEGSLRSQISKLVYSTTTDTLKDITEEKKSLPIRHGLIRKHGRVRMLTTYRDAHIYFLPHWILDMVQRNETMDSISEDVVGWWAKAGWQDGLGDKMGLREVFEQSDDREQDHSSSHHSGLQEEDMDIGSLSSTKSSNLQLQSTLSTPSQPSTPSPSKLTIPPILAYIHPAAPTAPLIRRVDTSALLLSISLALAKLPSIDEVGRASASPFAHTHKVAYPAGVAQRCTISKADSLLAENVTVEEKSVIKECVIGSNCTIKSGARLTRCLLMDGVTVGERCQLTGCILGRRSQVGRESVLKDCEVQEGNVVGEEVDAKGEKFMVFEGLEEDAEAAMVEEEEEEEDGED